MSYSNMLAADSSVLLYRPELREAAGSVTATILLSQIAYWWKVSKGEFYKFKAPCSHSKYIKGDSWTEELAFGLKELNTAEKKLIENGFITKRVTMDRLTYYKLDTDHLDSVLKGLYVNDQPAVTTCPKGGYINAEAEVCSITENTAENTTENSLPDSHSPKKTSKPKNKVLLDREIMRDERFKPAFVKLLEENEINPTPQIWKLTTGSFMDYWMQDTTAKYKKSDWLATWRNWVRNDIKSNGWRYRIEQQKQGNSIMPKDEMQLPSDDNLLGKWARANGAPEPKKASDYTYPKYRADLETWIKRQNQEIAA